MVWQWKGSPPCLECQPIHCTRICTRIYDLLDLLAALIGATNAQIINKLKEYFPCLASHKS